MTAAVTVAQSGSPGVSLGFKNRIINGGMRIDQRNAGASVTPANGAYTLDRWFALISQSSKFTVQQNAGSVTQPAGFINYLGCTSSSAYSVGSSEYFIMYQYIEGLNVADLAWGTVNAKPVTLSFQVYSSLTGTFGGSLINNDNNRSYPFSYTVSSANTWATASVTIPGDTTGTWLTTNGVGIKVGFSLGAGATVSGTAGSWSGSLYRSSTGATSIVGTNGATFYITGVQLEKGTAATSFDYRPLAQELTLCERYYESSYPFGVKPGSNGPGVTTYYRNYNAGTTLLIIPTTFKTRKRTTPTVQCYDNSGNAGKIGVNDNVSDPDNQAAVASALGTQGIMVQSNSGATINGMRYLYTAECEL